MEFPSPDDRYEITLDNENCAEVCEAVAIELVKKLAQNFDTKSAATVHVRCSLHVVAVEEQIRTILDSLIGGAMAYELTADFSATYRGSLAIRLEFDPPLESPTFRLIKDHATKNAS